MFELLRSDEGLLYLVLKMFMLVHRMVKELIPEHKRIERKKKVL
jgi:hypothetical protein